MAEYEYVTRGQDDGALIAKSATEKVGFYGATPVVQAATPAATVTAGSTTTVCNTAVGEIQAALKALGIMASA